MECSQNLKVTKEEVLAKLKDDGDFDRLRRKIIQKLKSNQSAALNRPGAETMKPRQLSDDIYHDVGEKVMSRISDGLWGIIRSSDDGMKTEISETVLSVYDKLTNPGDNADGVSSGRVVQVECSDNGVVIGAASGPVVDGVADNELKDPPRGFSMSCNHQDDNDREKGVVVEQRGMSQDKMDTEDVDRVVAPGFYTDTEQKEECGGSDEDPDVPPGFG
ncbi:uncharacterized protein LOC126795135 isoform X2 [Argentina anserina]|uniref:uncharacterized protein LOC126795135 isoform X2 n=1 Tax=Argentina anserina TaxID=57926 RepID=UPI0021765ACD|nr:uncharacterized protein LOC126795135 isoform X2 [Potentilla anserina]